MGGGNGGVSWESSERVAAQRTLRPQPLCPRLRGALAGSEPPVCLWPPGGRSGQSGQHVGTLLSQVGGLRPWEVATRAVGVEPELPSASGPGPGPCSLQSGQL